MSENERTRLVLSLLQQKLKMIMLEGHNNVVLAVRCIDDINDSKYRNDLLDRMMYIYRIFLIVKSFLKEIMLRKLYKLRKNIFCITNIENTVQKEKSSFLSVVTIVMSKLRIDVEIRKERTMVVMSRSRDVTSISLEISVDVSHVLTNKTGDIEKENVLRENVLEKLEYS